MKRFFQFEDGDFPASYVSLPEGNCGGRLAVVMDISHDMIAAAQLNWMCVVVGQCGWWICWLVVYTILQGISLWKGMPIHSLEDGIKHQNETQINQLNQVKENSTQEMCAAKKACKKAYPRSQVNVWMVNFRLAESWLDV